MNVEEERINRTNYAFASMLCTPDLLVGCSHCAPVCESPRMRLLWLLGRLLLTCDIHYISIVVVNSGMQTVLVVDYGTQHGCK